MADPKSYQEILQEQLMIKELIDLPNTDDEEKEELAMLWRDLKSREAYKFDAIIGGNGDFSLSDFTGLA